MKQTWRWFGPHDTIGIHELHQAGVQGVVSALHHIKPGLVWSKEAIVERQAMISRGGPESATPIHWDVVESLPVSEAIKLQSADFKEHVANYKTSLQNIAASGIKTVCYNFMPVLDWTRTDLRRKLPHGGTAMWFDLLDFAAFDLFLLKRPGASDDYDADFCERARQRASELSDQERQALQQNIVAGLPGANDTWTLDEIRVHLSSYQNVSADTLRQHLIDFLSEVAPEADRLGLRLCCHPDDPPFSLLGLPRVMSTENDYRRVMEAVDINANGITLCTGSLGVSPEFDGVGFVERLGGRIHFAHLRSTMRVAPANRARTSFFEAAHLEGDIDIVGVVEALLGEEKRRRAEGRDDHEIPMRPDHGQDLLSDLSIESMPGYPLIGRMRGLAELRGVMSAFERETRN
ncbi:Mannonate dehydratase [Labrenzia sp. THAF82]|uniref:mannonate dehydratase n=1 Tax=Labrenzia sp. THAF82 TaxID=2587861 RepID=UPI001268C03F|nr:mannonate dehydratase [Labrenzia sp. THAF82]QFT30562.1 Mannonate dehydratase [Labrenzia sp. THAF82]